MYNQTFTRGPAHDQNNFESTRARALNSEITTALQHPLRTVDSSVNANMEVTARVKHTMKPGETNGEWFARTQIGKAELFSMTPEQIESRVALADERNAQDPILHPQFLEKRIVPSKFMLE